MRRSSQPFATRPFAAKSTTDYPSSLNRSLSQHFSYFSQTDPHLTQYYKRKSNRLCQTKGRQLQTATAPLFSPDRDRRVVQTERNSSRQSDSAGEQLQTYRVAVKTGEAREHGTRARVFVTLRGTGGQLSKRRVPAKKVDEEEDKSVLSPGSVHKFSLKGKDIGDLKEIVVESSGLKKEDAWFLEHITVIKRSTGQRWGCMCRQWLSLFHTDCQTIRVLPARSLSVAQTPSDTMDYSVKVHTADVRGAGTDANVFITLSGTKGNSPKTSIGNKFPRGSVEEKDLHCCDLGRLLSASLEHDNTGFCPAWLVDKVVVSTLLTIQPSVVFPCGQWLARDMGDGETVRTLTPHSLTNKENSREDYVHQQQQCRYVVTTHTGRMQGAGTDSQVFLTMCGTTGQSRQHMLDNSAENFQRGRVDKFLVEDCCVGEITSLDVQLVQSGLSPDWFLDHIEVQEWESEEKPLLFPCVQWIHASRKGVWKGEEGGGRPTKLHRADLQADSMQEHVDGQLHSLSGELNKGDSKETERETLLPESEGDYLWLVKVVTSDIIGAGTDASVFIQVHTAIEKKARGDNDDDEEEEEEEEGVSQIISERLWLEDRPEYFERGQVDEFRVKLPRSIGLSVTGLTVGHDNSNPYPEWHLDYIELLSEDLGVHYRFSCHQWLSTAIENGKGGGGDVVCFLAPVVLRTWTPQHCPSNNTVSTKSTTTAVAPATTRDSDGSAENRRQSYSPEQDHTTITPAPTTLPPSGHIPVETGVPYSIHVTLAEKPEQNSKGHLVVSLVGSLNSSPPLHLLPLSKPDLLPSRTEVYSVHCPSVGAVNSIKLWLESSEEHEQWCVQEVAVHCPASNSVYHLAAGDGSACQWLESGMVTTLLLTAPTPSSTITSGPRSHSRSSTVTSFAAALTAYEVKFLTADKKLAGTIGNVHLVLVGERECSKVFQFQNRHCRRFQRGQTDTFHLAIQKDRIGPITAVKVAHSCPETQSTGEANSWYLYKVVLTRLHDRHRMHFTCGQWLCVSHSEQLQFTEIALSPKFNSQ